MPLSHGKLTTLAFETTGLSPAFLGSKLINTQNLDNELCALECILLDDLECHWHPY
jgi:hypothetical protein